MNTLPKQKDHAFGKDVFLIGRNKYGENLWLEAAQWDCNWYWGFGYVEVYQGNKGQSLPSKAQDISSHSHFNSLIGFKTDSGDYIHHLNESTEMSATTLSDKESWEICDLMKSFYTLKDAAGIFHSGSSHLTTTEIDLKNTELYDRINKEIMPRIFARVYEILAPTAEEASLAA